MAQRKKVLIIDDSFIDRSTLKSILSGIFEVAEAENAFDALSMIMESKFLPDIILLDIMMPVLDGFSVLGTLEEKGFDIPVILISAEATETNVIKAAAHRLVRSFISKPYERETVQEKIITLLGGDEIGEFGALSDQEIAATKTFISKLEHLRSEYNAKIGMSDAKYECLYRVMKEVLPKYSDSRSLNWGENHVEFIAKAAYLCDIGTILLPDSIVRKGDDMDVVEKAKYTAHTENGVKVLELNSEPDCFFFQKNCEDICRYHHERADGSGYPEKLKGPAIPELAQLVGIVMDFIPNFALNNEFNERRFDNAMASFRNKPAYNKELCDLLRRCKRAIINIFRELKMNEQKL